MSGMYRTYKKRISDLITEYVVTVSFRKACKAKEARVLAIESKIVLPIIWGLYQSVFAQIGTKSFNNGL